MPIVTFIVFLVIIYLNYINFSPSLSLSWQ
jgi:hypothetical protein